MYIPRFRYTKSASEEKRATHEAVVPEERYQINKLNRAVIRVSSILVNGGESLAKVFQLIDASNTENLEMHKTLGRTSLELYGRLGRFTTDNKLAWQVGYQCSEDLLGLDTAKNSYGMYATLKNDLTLNVELPKMISIPHSELGRGNIFHDWRLENLPLPKFLMSETEITKAQYIAVLGYDSSEDTPLIRKTIWRLGMKIYWDFIDQSMRPVNSCTWYDTILFCNGLSKLQGLPPYYKISEAQQVEDEDFVKVGTSFAKVQVIDKYGCGYRLPRAVEWEYAANCQQGFNFSGSDELDEIAWYFDNVKSPNDPYAKCVKEKKPNRWGLYDMTGNVSELVSDRADPVSPKVLVTKGGNVSSLYPEKKIDAEGNPYYSYTDSELLTRNRGSQSRDDYSQNTGFRVCRTIYPNSNGDILDPLNTRLFQKTFTMRALRYDMSKLTRKT